MPRPNFWPWLRPFLILLAVISVPPLLYWFVYVQSSVQATRERAHGTLSAVAVDLRDGLTAQAQIAARVATVEAPSEAQRKWLEAYLKSALGSSTEYSPHCAQVAPTKPAALPTPVSQPISIEGESGGMVVSFHTAFSTGNQCTTRVKLPIDNLVSWDLVAADFDGLLILDSNGKLLAQDRRLPTQPLGEVVQLHGWSPQVATPSPPSEPQTIETTESPKRAPLIPSGPFDFHRDVQFELAGSTYLVFIQPVRVTVAPTANSKATAGYSTTVNVCGLIRASNLRSEAIALSPQTLVSICSLLAFGLFAIPFLKLRFIGARERLRKRDVWLLAGSMLAGLGLAVLSVMDLNAQRELTRQFDRALENTLEIAAKQTRAETQAALATLRATAPALLAAPRTEIGSILSSGNGSGERRFDYADFDSVYSLDATGFQRQKWATRTLASPNSNLADREYFTRALTLNGAGPDYYFEPVTSRSTASQLGVIAMPATALTSSTPSADRSTEPVAAVVAMAMRMRSLNNPVLIKPMQLVLVDRHGKVQFLNARGPYVSEYFFQNVRGGAALANDARRTPALKATVPRTYEYRGELLHMSATFLPELEATLVGYYNPQVVDSLVARAFGAASLFVLAMILSMLIGAVLPVCWRGKRAFEWAWPAPARTGVYVLGCVISVLTMLLVWLIRALEPTPNVFAWFIILLPLTVMIVLGSGNILSKLRALATRLNLQPDADTVRSRRRTALAFQGAAVMTLLALIAWPAAIVFDDALAAHTGAYENHLAHQLVADQDKRDAKLRAEVVTAHTVLAAPGCQGTLSESNSDIRCRAIDRVFATQRNVDALRDGWNRYGNHMGCVNFLTGRPCATEAPTLPAAAPWSFTSWLVSALISRTEESQSLLQEFETIRNSQDSAEQLPLFYWHGWWKWATLAVIALLALLCLLIGSVSKHVLGIGVLHDVLLDESQCLSPSPGTRWLLLRPSPGTLARVNVPCTTIDLRDSTITATALIPPIRGAALVVRHVESKLADSGWRKSLLDLLRARSEGSVILVSDIDPLFYITQRAAEKENHLALTETKSAAQDSTSTELQRLRTDLAEWSATLRETRKLREFVQLNGRLEGGTASEETRRRIRAECGASEPLIEIGERLLQRADIDAYRWDDIVDFVLDAAEPFYRSAWELCSREEQLVLIQLAQEGLVNPKRLELARRLARRNLVAVGPHLRPMNESFARFLRAVEPPEQIARWEHSGSGHSWSRYGTPLYALAAVVIAILLFTQQETLTNIMGVLAAAGGALGTLRGLYTANVKAISPSSSA